ncbi:hypothetical protein Q1695_006104 [Nippostrongylus brasiliensis]|nr:hypothetical protein Q1695_006104 [Nippostrongylus brasiliensis]
MIVACILLASYYFYSNHKYLTYVRTADSFEAFETYIRPHALSSVMDNKCYWPILKPVSTVNVDVHHFKVIRCEAVMEAVASLDDFGFLEVSRPIVGGDLYFDSEISCYYKAIVNTTDGELEIGKPVQLKFNTQTRIFVNQFVVICLRDSAPETPVYRKPFVNVPMLMGPAAHSKFVKGDPELPSLAMLVFDSVSLNHFKRNMPRTMKFLFDNDFFTFNMYNEVGSDGDANLMDILKGGANDENETAPFLWDLMRDRNCKTYLSEEIGNFPSFFGNRSLNVDHDLRPYYAYSLRTTKEHCTLDGRVASHEYLNNWRDALLHSKKRCHFSLHYMRSLTRANQDYLAILDTELRESLEVLKANGLFEDTVFVLVSDRGNPLRVMDELFTGRVEERTPLLSIKLPEKFLRKYYSSKATMEYNVNRLTTTRDVALTLKDLATMDFRGFKRKHSIGPASLLRVEHAMYRSCDDADIPPHMCLCMDEKTMLSQKYKNDTPEFKQLFEYTKKEILRNDCLEDVVEDSDENTLKVMSLNPMVQQGIRGEKEWKHDSNSNHSMGVYFVDVAVLVYPFPRVDDIKRTYFKSRMRFRQTHVGFEPIGTPSIQWKNHKCFADIVDKYCEKCFYSRMVLD